MANGGQWSRGRTIGRGSTATVSIATSSLSGHVFAVKSAELSQSGLLQREYALLSALDHPNIISCHGFDVSADGASGRRRLQYNLFLEYAPGGSIADHVRKRGGAALDESAIAACVRDVLRGLAYLHSRHLAHCDIKGQNVLLGLDGRAKIADFGCARASSAAARPVPPELPIMGTPMFMAPEVARGEDQGPPADVWALGCMVIEMATGGPPWPETVGGPASALQRIGFSSDVPEFPCWLSHEARDFLDKCLRRAAGDRWTAAELLRHSFVAMAANFSPETESSQTWVTPKSILEQGLWEAVAEEEAKEEEEEKVAECKYYGPADRIRHLTGGHSPAAASTWDDDGNGWITVRSSDENSTFDQIVSNGGVLSSSVGHILDRSDELSVNVEAVAVDELISDDIDTVHGCDPSNGCYYDQTEHCHCSFHHQFANSSCSAQICAICHQLHAPSVIPLHCIRIACSGSSCSRIGADYGGLFCS